MANYHSTINNKESVDKRIRFTKSRKCYAQIKTKFPKLDGFFCFANSVLLVCRKCYLICQLSIYRSPAITEDEQTKNSVQMSFLIFINIDTFSFGRLQLAIVQFKVRIRLLHVMSSNLRSLTSQHHYLAYWHILKDTIFFQCTQHAPSISENTFAFILFIQCPQRSAQLYRLPRNSFFFFEAIPAIKQKKSILVSYK